ncbi:MAG: lytic murein transglycosylase [Paracoccaceae bacterium]
MLGLSAAVLWGCSIGPSVRGPVAQDAFRPAPNPDFDAWVVGFKPRAASRGISQATLDSAFRSVGYLPGVIEKDNTQTEFARTLQDYLAITASDARIAKGRQVLQQYAGLFEQIEAKYGVEKQVVAAVWGVESFYGTKRGTVPVISALSTLAFDGRRGEFFEGQLIAALKILQNGDVSVAGMTGSWAGAMGHTQFIPTSYLAYAVDFNGDGRRDIWSDDPTDSLASTASYLAKSGWSNGQPWGVEVRLPSGFDLGLVGKLRARSTANWTSLGITAANGGRLADHGSAAVILPAGSSGPAFLIYHNFAVIGRYNNADNYIIGVGVLSDRLAGGGALVGSFPPDSSGMRIADRVRLQERLTALGFDTGSTDGVMGPKTAAAISSFQQSRGLVVDGRASLELLSALG